MTMFVSTRGSKEEKTCAEVALLGVAPDGGLWMPVEFPRFTLSDITAMRSESLSEKTFRIFRAFGLTTDIPDDDLHTLCKEAFKKFTKDTQGNILPLVEFDDWKFFCNFHNGPTQAFKDYPLAVLGQIVGYLLKKQGKQGVVIGATSGDTGPAAMANVANDNIFVHILYPHEGTSVGQEKQMVHFSGEHAKAYALEGCSFDDCQKIAREGILNDREFLQRMKSEGKIVFAINSINWVRIAAQIGYMFDIALHSRFAGQSSLNIVIPSANFGNALSAYVAKCMGAPIDFISLVTNENNILQRVALTGTHHKKGVIRTSSPAMDIDFPSNFERFLSDLYGSEKVAQWYLDDGNFTIKHGLYRINHTFSVEMVNQESVRDTIKLFYDKYGIVIDPHTATAASIVERASCVGFRGRTQATTAFSTAHPCKFDDAVRNALGDQFSDNLIYDGVSSEFLIPYQMSEKKLNRRRVIIEGATPEVIKEIMMQK